MPSIFSRFKIWKIIRLILLLVLLVGVLDLLEITNGSFFNLLKNTGNSYWTEIVSRPLSSIAFIKPTRENPYDLFSARDDLVNYPIESKKLFFEVNPGQITASYEILLAKDHPLFQLAQQQESLFHFDKIVELFFDKIEVSNKPLQFNSPKIIIKETEDKGQILLESKPAFNYGSTVFLLSVALPTAPNRMPIKTNEIIFSTSKTQVTCDSFPPLYPVSKTPEATRYSVAQEHNPVYFYINTDEIIAAPDDEQSIASYMSKNITIPFLGSLIFGILQASPFLLFILWRNRLNEADDKATLLTNSVSLIKVYLWFHIGYFAIFLTQEVYSTWGNPVYLILDRIHANFSLPFTYYSSNTYILLALILFISLWQVIVRRYERVRSPKPRKFSWLKPWVSRLTFVVSLLGLAGWAVWQGRETIKSGFILDSIGSFYAAYYSALLFGLFLIVTWLVFELFDRPRPGLAIGSFFILILLLFADVEIKGYLHELVLSGLVYVFTAFLFLYAFYKVSYNLLFEKPFSQSPAYTSGWQRILIFIGLLLMVASSRSWRAPVQWWPLWSLISETETVFTLVLCALLVKLLYQYSSVPYWSRLPNSVRYLGILLALILFFSPTGQWWWYLPIPSVLGVFLLDKWLLNKHEYENDLISQIKNRLKEIIYKVIDFNDGNRLLKLLKKEMPAKVGKGEAEYSKYKEKVGEIKQEIEEMRSKLTIEGRFAKSLVLAFGPTDSPWQNGVIYARYSLYFAILWFILYLRSIVNAPAPSDSYFLLHLINSMLSFLTTWIGYGFFFGYFYPYIRGRNGLEKGFSFFIVLLIPYLITTALSSPTNTANWLSFLFIQLQLFLHTLLLGLIAGDFETLRRAEFRFGQLLQFYNLTSLSAWASTIVIAMGAAITTLVSSGATEILSLALKQMGLIPQELKLPTK